MCVFSGSAEDCTEWAGTVGQFARADEQESDDAFLQQPHDVLSDQHKAPAGCKPKTDRWVQPRWTTTVSTMCSSQNHKVTY